MQAPQPLFASVGNDRVAYQVFGNGPRDLVHAFGLWAQVDVIFEDPATVRYLKRLASFSRVILFDCRGSGISDARPPDGRSIDQHWCDDLLAVLDAAGARAPVIFGVNDAGPLQLRFAGLHPDRCGGLIFFNTTARFSAAPDYPIGFKPEDIARFEGFFRAAWGNERWQQWFVPSLAGNTRLARWLARWARAQASPTVALRNVREIADVDGREVLPRLRVPVLSMTRSGSPLVPVAHGRYLAEHAPGARFVELPGSDGLPLFESADEILDLVEEFVPGGRRARTTERTLATIMFTDIVDSTMRAAQLGDGAWRRVLDQHDRTVREQVDLHRGRLVEMTGDGTLATFGSPEQAIDCALGLHRQLAELGVPLRSGVHTGTVELRDDGRIGGLAVHIGARVLAAASPGEVLASRTVHDVLIGSRYAFAERGSRALKGVPGEWALYAVSGAARE